MAKIEPHIFGRHDEKVIAQLENCIVEGKTRAAALCADAHFGYSMPIGGVVAYEAHVAPACVGFDIACGNKAVRTDLTFRDVAGAVPRIMDEIFSTIEFGIGRRDGSNIDHPVMEDPLWNDVPRWVRDLKNFAAGQLGTVGAGNHYVDLFRDEEGRIWVGVHFGSRGFGHKVASGFLNVAAGRRHDEGKPKDLSMETPALLAVDSSAGEDYWNAMTLAGKYAYAGRDVVCDRVLGFLGASKAEEVHNNHNFAWKEKIGAREAIVIRKGATPAFPGQRGFVGSTMGEESVIIEGTDTPESRSALYSAMHGAGRVMSRNKAAGTWKKFRKGGKTQRVRDHASGVVDWRKVVRELQASGIELRGGAADEAPEVYKRLSEVIAAHGDTIRVVARLTPIGVAMAGRDVHDPYRD